MIIEILFIMTVFLWFLSILPVAPATQFSWANSWLAFVAVLLLGLFIFLPGMR